MSIGSSRPSSGPSTCWKSNTPSPSSSAASQTALVPGALMNARRTPGSVMNRTISAPLFVPRVSVWITCSAWASQTATSSPRQVGSMPGAHSAGGPNVVLIAVSASGVIAKSYMYVGTGVVSGPVPARAEVVDELAGLIVDLDDAAGLGLIVGRADHRRQHHAVHRHHAVGNGVAAVGGEVLVDRAERHRRAVAVDVEDVDPVGEQPGHDQACWSAEYPKWWSSSPTLGMSTRLTIWPKSG